MIDVTFQVPGPPHGKGRPRAARRGRHIVMHTDDKTTSYGGKVAMCARAALGSTLIEGPIRVDMVSIMVRPQRLNRRQDAPGLLWAPTKPDRDNIDKAILDGMAAHWRDDAEVVFGVLATCYAEIGGQPRVIVRVRTGLAEPADMLAEVLGGPVVPLWRGAAT